MSYPTIPPPDDPWSVPVTPAPSVPGIPQQAAHGPGPVILQIGDLGVTSSVVHTPAGDIPLAGSTWTVNDYWHHETRIPRWAIIASILGFCVLTVFSLLFLLVKTTVATGTVQITVTNGTRQYVSRLPVADQAQLTAIHQQVNYVRSLAAL